MTASTLKVSADEGQKVHGGGSDPGKGPGSRASAWFTKDIVVVLRTDNPAGSRVSVALSLAIAVRSNNS